jgi:hypothetical protein
MNEYVYLSPDQARQIRRNRLHDLESQHYGALIMLEEEPKNGKLLATLTDLARRIEHHAQVLADDSLDEQVVMPEAPAEASIDPRTPE